jgi:hypothetical protein
MIPTQEAIINNAALVPAPPVAIEAFWHGDTDGWYVVLTMLYAAGAPPRRRTVDLIWPSCKAKEETSGCSMDTRRPGQKMFAP